MSDSEGEISRTNGKNPRGRPRKKSKLDDVTLGDVERLFEKIEKKLTTSLSKLVSEALAPLQSLVDNKIKALSDRLDIIENDFRLKMESLNSEVEQLQLPVASMIPSYAEAAAKTTSAPTPAESATQSYLQPQEEPSHQVRSRPTQNLDRKYNLVIYGIPECPQGTQRHIRIASDLENVTTTLAKLDESFNEHSIRDCHRLGTYKQDATSLVPSLLVSTELLMSPIYYPNVTYYKVLSSSSPTCLQLNVNRNQSSSRNVGIYLNLVTPKAPSGSVGIPSTSTTDHTAKY